MMAIIALKGMHFHSFHGYYAEEHSVGNNYEIDVELHLPGDFKSLNDELSRTINYETIYQICQKEMAKSSRLIEMVAQNIHTEMKNLSGEEVRCTVIIRKLNPLLGGLVDYASVELHS